MPPADKNLLSNLILIGKHDAALARIKAERKSIESVLEAQAAEMKKIEIEMQAKGKVLKEKKDRYQREEKSLRDEREKLVQRRKSLTSLSSYKLQQAAEREIEHASRQLGSKEEVIISFLEEADKIEKELNLLNDSLSALKSKNEQSKKDAAETFVNFEERSARYLSEREEVAKVVEPGSLAVYDRIKDRHPMDAVVLVVNNTCSGCFMQIVPQLMVQILKGDTLVRCRGCGRIIFADGSIKEGQSKEG